MASQMDGINVIGVQFRRAGRIYDFSSGGLDLKVGDDVVVDTERGPSLAKVADLRYGLRGEMKGEEGGLKSLKPIMRVATKRDLDDTRKLSPEAAVAMAKERCERIGVKMSVLQAEVQFGGSKVIVYFAAAGRVDFRDLVKELATVFKARVELKQVGARDEAKLVGGLGICGREFCCSSFLREFVPVSIKMAKNQNLALNPSKVSGGCGRLLCCLTYENDLYTELRKKLPPRGTRVRHPEDGIIGTVLKGDVLNQNLLIMTEDERIVSVKLKDVEILEKKATPAAPEPEDGAEGDAVEAEMWGEDIDLAALSALEDKPKGDGGGGSQAKGGGGRGGQGGGGDRGPRSDRGGRGGGSGNRGDRGPRGGGSQGGGSQQGPRDRGPRRDDRPKEPSGGKKSEEGGGGDSGGEGSDGTEN